MNRIDWIVEKFGRTLMTAATFIHGETYETARDAIENILQADPTHNKKFARWLVDAYIRGDYRTEDCEKAFETLKLFQAHSSKLDQKHRDIGQHSSIGEIWKLVKGFVENAEETQSGKEKRRSERAKAREESLILLEEADVIVAVPLTRFAAIWWGRGTRWCTSMKNAIHFESYRKGPLFVIICHSMKVQAYVYDGCITIMDDNDAPLGDNERAILKEKVPDLMEWFARACNDPTFMPEERMDLEFLQAAIRANGESVRYLLPRLLTKELYLEAIESYPAAIATIPEEIINAEMCMKAVRLDGLCFPYLPLKFQTREMLLIALQRWGYLLDLIPENDRTKEQCETAIRTGVVNLASIPNKLWNEDLAEMILMHVNYSLEYLREHRPEFLSDAVNSIGHRETTANGRPIWTRHDRITPELCVIAVRNDKDAWQYVPKEMRTEEVVQAQISRAGNHSCSSWGWSDAIENQSIRRTPTTRKTQVFWNECPETVEAVKDIFSTQGIEAKR